MLGRVAFEIGLLAPAQLFKDFVADLSKQRIELVVVVFIGLIHEQSLDEVIKDVRG